MQHNSLSSKIAPLALSVVSSFLFFSMSVSAEDEQNQTEESAIETVTIVASEGNRLSNAPGASITIPNVTLSQFQYADIQRVLRGVPGVAIQLEDGYGLRPNISIRGVASERSGRITLLEDNVLIAPAPYSAPSAYYFPTAGRMHAIEVLKGPSAISQGPYTIGGSLNLVSTPIPNSPSGSVMGQLGEDATGRFHGWYGRPADDSLGFLLETHQWKSDGFQSIDRSDTPTGLELNDYTLKVRMNPASNQKLELKLQIADQISNQSYLGLTDTDFNQDPYRRYGVSELDNIETAHQQAIASYDIEVSDATQFRAAAYINLHERNWYKTEGIDLDGSENAESFSRRSWSSVIQSINRRTDIGSTSWEDVQGILNGSVDTAPGSIQIRSNKREYVSRGIQFWANHELELGNVTHNFSVSLRSHYDEEDRVQRNSTFHQEAGRLVMDDLGMLGNAGNRLQEAKATALFIEDNIDFGKLTISPGFRYESIEQMRTRWEIRPGRTDNPASRSVENLRSMRENDTTVFSPGVGVSYTSSPQVELYMGAYKGFTAPSNSPGVDAESANIFETGLRYASSTSPFNAEIAAFITDYENLLGECTASSGTDCEIGDAFNGDAASVMGVEAQLESEIQLGDTSLIPLRLSLTLFNAEFKSDIADTDFFGDVSVGDPIPYLPDTQFQIMTGIDRGSFRAFLHWNYSGEVCVRASCGDYEKVDAFAIANLSFHYDFSDSIQGFARIDNLADNNVLVARHPYGARPARPRTMLVGASASF